MGERDGAAMDELRKSSAAARATSTAARKCHPPAAAADELIRVVENPRFMLTQVNHSTHILINTRSCDFCHSLLHLQKTNQKTSGTGKCVVALQHSLTGHLACSRMSCHSRPLPPVLVHLRLLPLLTLPLRPSSAISILSTLSHSVANALFQREGNYILPYHILLNLGIITYIHFQTEVNLISSSTKDHRHED